MVVMITTRFDTFWDSWIEVTSIGGPLEFDILTHGVQPMRFFEGLLWMICDAG